MTSTSSPALSLVDLAVLEAKALYGEITPCDGKTWDECLTYELGCQLLWFNTPDGSTHVLTGPFEGEQA